MKYAILYYSETGNTKELAEEIYLTLPVTKEEKIIVNVASNSKIPDADFYFIGFPVHNCTYPLNVLPLIEEIEDAEIAFFVTCGLTVEDKYKEYIEKAVLPWINESCEYGGLFMCQGKSSNLFKQKMLDSTDSPEPLEAIFNEGDKHPDDDDFENIDKFVEDLIG